MNHDWIAVDWAVGREISNDDKKKREIYDSWAYFPLQVWKENIEMFISNVPPPGSDIFKFKMTLHQPRMLQCYM